MCRTISETVIINKVRFNFYTYIYQSEGFRNGVMLSLGALGFGAVHNDQVVLLLLLLPARCKMSGLRT